MPEEHHRCSSPGQQGARSAMQAPDVFDQGEYVTETLALLWPQGSEPRGSGRALKMVSLPNRQNPRLILPRSPRRMAATALRNYKASATGADKVKARVVSFGARLGALEMLPSKFTIRASSVSIDEHLSSLMGTRIAAGLYIGPPRAVQKPVLQLLDPAGQTLGFAKIGTNYLTRALLRREAETIELLQSSNLRSIRTPAILARSTWEGNEVIVQSAIAPGGSQMRLRQLLSVATYEVARCQGTVSEFWVGSAYRVRLCSRLDSVGQSRHAKDIRNGIALLDGDSHNTTLEFGSWHGDWAPWNMTTRDQAVIAWDWEHFEFGVPIGFDAIHYDVARSVMHGARPVHALRAVLYRGGKRLMGAHFRSDVWPRIVLLYCLELASRYILDGEDRMGGTTMSRLDEWLPAMVNECGQAFGTARID